MLQKVSLEVVVRGQVPALPLTVSWGKSLFLSGLSFSTCKRKVRPEEMWPALSALMA